MFSIGGSEGNRGATRRFTDASGLAWSVFAVENPASQAGFQGEFLCFERGIDRRRLMPIPADWTKCGAAQLDEYRGMAKPVHRSFASPDQFSERRK